MSSRALEQRSHASFADALRRIAEAHERERSRDVAVRVEQRDGSTGNAAVEFAATSSSLACESP
jgi:hypothetical protein